MSNAGRLLSRLSSGLAWVNDRREDRRSRTLTLPGLSRPVDVAWDRAGVPHVSAANRRDLFVAQGWVTARERSFQMDFLRRAVSGRLAEVLGRRPVGWKALTIHLEDKSVADADLLLRTLGLRRGAERSLPLLSPAAREALEAYAYGATVALRALERDRPLEFRLLRYAPDPWTPLDSLSIQKGLAFELSMAWRSVLLFDALAARLGDDGERLRALFPDWPTRHAPDARWTETPELRAALDALRARSGALVGLEETARAFTATGGAHVGSNAWVVSGALTDTGHPMLAGDPHLMLSAPSPHMVVHLHCPDLEVVGSSIPGLPGVIIGHNRRVAWTMTASLASDADVFVEELDLARGLYRVDDAPADTSTDGAPRGWAKLERRVERFKVKGEPNAWEVEVLETRHGPLVDGVVHPLGRPRREALGYALRWTGQDGSREVDTLLALQSATGWASFRDALRGFGGPPLNFVYADVDGHIGWQVAGHVPVRRDGSDGAQPSPGHDDRAGWLRYLTLDELPHTFDPPEGYIASANTKPVDARYPFPLGHTFEPPYRYRRIVERLEEARARGPITLDAMRAIQLDRRSLWGAEAAAAIARALADTRFERPELQALLERLRAWDGQSEADALEPALLHATYHHLVKLVLERVLRDDRLAHAYLELLNVSVQPFERFLTAPRSPLWPEADRRALAEEAFLRAFADLTDRMGPDPAKWRWGRIHTLWHRHRLHELKALRAVLSIGPFELGGDGFTVWNAHHGHTAPYEVVLGPGVRVLFDLGDWNRSRFVLSTGNGGNVSSPRYRDHAAAWASGRDFPLWFERTPPDASVREHLVPPP